MLPERLKLVPLGFVIELLFEKLNVPDEPLVMMPVPLEGVPCTLVQVDNRGGMRAAVEHLIDHGH